MGNPSMQGLLGHYSQLIPERQSLGGYILSNIVTFHLICVCVCVCVFPLPLVPDVSIIPRSN